VESAKSVESREAKKDTGRIGVENTALVVIDMQRAFLDKGAPLECPGAEALVPGIDEIAAVCRSLRIPVIFVKVLRFREVRETLAHLAG
jgi:nicotinamidase-related amidase